MGFWLDKDRNEELSRVDESTRQHEKRWIEDFRWTLLLAVIVMSAIYGGIWAVLTG